MIFCIFSETQSNKKLLSLFMDNGKLIIFSAPSGSGKTTIVRHLLKTFPEKIEFSISATSRAKRGIEENGKDYYYLSVEEFKQKLIIKSFGVGRSLRWHPLWNFKK